MTEAPPARRSRQWFQFPLRSLLLLMLVAAVVLGWWAQVRNGVRRERLALQAVRRLQAKMTKPAEHWVGKPLDVKTTPAPWWLALGSEKELNEVTALSFDLRSHDDGFEMESPVTDDHLRLFTAFPHLRSLEVPRSKISDEGLTALAHLPRLAVLDLSSTAVTDEGLKHLAAVESLEVLVLDRTTIDGSGLGHLNDCSELKILSLQQTPLLSRHADKLNDLHSIRSLKIAAPSLDQVHLHDLPNLRRLSLALSVDAEIRLESLPELWEVAISVSGPGRLRQLHLTDLPKLVSLSVDVNAADETEPAADTEISFRALPAVRQVAISGPGLARPAAAELGTLATLEDVSLRDPSGTFGDAEIRQFTGLKRMRRLALSHTQLTDDGLAALANMESLEILSLKSDRLTAEGVQSLGALPRLTTLRLSGLQQPGDLGPALRKLATLQDLSLGGCQLDSLTLTNEREDDAPDFARLTKFATHACNIGKVHIDSLSALDDVTLQARPRSIHIGNLPRLRRLDISLAREQTVEEFTLVGLPELRWMGLQGSGARVPASTFKHLREFPHLKNGILWGFEYPDSAREDLQHWEKATGKTL